MITKVNPIEEIIEKHADALTSVSGVAGLVDEAREIYDEFAEGFYEEGAHNQNRLFNQINDKLYGSLIRMKNVIGELWKKEYSELRNVQLKEMQRAYWDIFATYGVFDTILKQSA